MPLTLGLQYCHTATNQYLKHKQSDGVVINKEGGKGVPQVSCCTSSITVIDLKRSNDSGLAVVPHPSREGKFQTFMPYGAQDSAYLRFHNPRLRFC